MAFPDNGTLRSSSTDSFPTALAELVEEMSLSQRGNLIHLDNCLHDLWGLGENVILSWCPEGGGISVLMVPHYAVANYANEVAPDEDASVDPRVAVAEGAPRAPSEDFFKTLISGKRRLTPRQMRNVATLLGIEKVHFALRAKLMESHAEEQLIEQMVKRYSISYVP
ncbi:MAG TPA: hypothetical protein VIV14_02685, partial [Gammaproteobacteria bacterium]